MCHVHTRMQCFWELYDIMQHVCIVSHLSEWPSMSLCSKFSALCYCAVTWMKYHFCALCIKFKLMINLHHAAPCLMKLQCEQVLMSDNPWQYILYNFIDFKMLQYWQYCSRLLIKTTYKCIGLYLLNDMYCDRTSLCHCEKIVKGDTGFTCDVTD